MPLGDVPRYFEQKVAKRRERFAISTDSPELIPRVSKFTSRLAIPSHWGIIARALRSQPSQNSPHLHAFSPLLRSEGRNIEMEASSGRVWLQIFRNNRIGLCAMVPQVLLSDATVTHLPYNPDVHSPSLTCIVRSARFDLWELLFSPLLQIRS